MKVVWLTVLLVVINVAHSYVLLTASLDDIANIANQVVSSPVGNQLQRIWRRASKLVNEIKAEKGPKRNNYNYDDASNSAKEESFDNQRYNSYGKDSSVEQRRRSKDDGSVDQLDFGKNASVYLQSIKKIFAGL